MIPFKSLLTVDKASGTPVFIQLSDQLTQLIRSGTLPVGQRLPGTRQLARLLGLNRQTIVAAYDEATAQGWLESQAGSGTFVARHLPEVTPQLLTAVTAAPPAESFAAMGQVTPGYAFDTRPFLSRPVLTNTGGLRLDDGIPDIRLDPLDELGRDNRTYFLWGNTQQHF